MHGRGGDLGLAAGGRGICEKGFRGGAGLSPKMDPAFVCDVLNAPGPGDEPVPAVLGLYGDLYDRGLYYGPAAFLAVRAVQRPERGRLLFLFPAAGGKCPHLGDRLCGR